MKKTWLEFHAVRRLNEGAEELIVKAYQAMGAADKEKVNRILASPTWGDQWMNTIRTALRGKEALQPQQLAAIVLDGIDSYLSSAVTTSSQNSERVSRSATQRQVPGATAQANQPRADYQGNFGKTQTLWSRGDAKHGTVPDQEIRAKGLHQNHNLVWSGAPPAPAAYPYSWNRRDGRIVYNPNYQG